MVVRKEKGIVKVKKKPVFISFVEEGIMNPRYESYVGGRVEVYREGPYADEEIRFFTGNRKALNTFREKWDFEKITEEDLKEVRYLLSTEFTDYSEIS